MWQPSHLDCIASHKPRNHFCNERRQIWLHCRLGTPCTLSSRLLLNAGTRLHSVTSQNTVILKNRIIMSYLEVAVWVISKMHCIVGQMDPPANVLLFLPPAIVSERRAVAVGGTDVLSGRCIFKNLIRIATIFEVELISSSSLRQATTLTQWNMLQLNLPVANSVFMLFNDSVSTRCLRIICRNMWVVGCGLHSIIAR
jgi:hypothetical protein